MKTYDVFHRHPEGATLIATLRNPHDDEAEWLERLFEWTNNIDEGWTNRASERGLELSHYSRGGCRSTSVGDYVRVIEDVPGRPFAERWYKCEREGWALVAPGTVPKQARS